MDPASIDILTPQGYLSEIQKNPNLDVAMNLFRIPRAFTISGFGDWNVGQHSFCVAFLALYWSRFREYGEARRDQLIVLALTHDLHEAATGDILPGLKNEALKEKLKQVQTSFLTALGIWEDPELLTELKILDYIAFLYEIQRAQTINPEQRDRLQAFFRNQKEALRQFCAVHQIEGLEAFLDTLGVFHE